MKTKIAINGFGRIGRNAFKIAFARSDLEVVAVNDLTDTKTLAHLLKHDSNYGSYQNEVSFDDQNIIVDGQKIRVLAEKDPAKLPWRDMAIDVVIESTGLFVDPAKARAHIDAGAKKVIISAPAKGMGAETVVIGVNDDKLAETGDVISNASCTTNCITPVMAVLESNFGIDKAMMTTVHSYTASQRLQDAPAKDLREARNAATNIVPTTTGASIAAAKAMPALEGIFGGLSIRVPTPVVSLSDFSVLTKQAVTVETVNEAFKKAAEEPYYQGILTVTDEPLVSSDFIGNSHSAIVDLSLTAVIADKFLKVVAWYDNEWGYSNRLVEITADAGKLLWEAENSAENSDQSKAGAASSQDNKADDELASPAEKDDTDADSDKSSDILKEPEEPLLEAPDESEDKEEVEKDKDSEDVPPHESLEYNPSASYVEPPKPEESPKVIGSPPSSPSHTEEDKPEDEETENKSPFHHF